MSSIIVLCPNARRQQIKVQPNTKILQVIEEVCKKQGLNPDEYELIHLKRKVDVTSTYRLSGIPNNACLDLIKLDIARQMGNITIALQLEDGTRLSPIDFKPDTHLDSVINTFRQSNTSLIEMDTKQKELANSQPVVSYLNDEIISDFQLENTQLKDFGLTNGRVVIRYHYRQIDSAQMDDLNLKFKEKIDKLKQLDEKFKAKQYQTQETFKKGTENEESQEKLVGKMDTDEEQKHEPLQVIQQFQYQQPQHQPNQQQPQQSQQQHAQEQLQSIQQNEFANFKFPENTKGMKLNDNHNELAEYERISKTVCDREALVFSLKRELIETEVKEEPSDEFFDVNVADLRSMINDLQRKVNEDAVLMTREMRELENDKKAMRYEKVAIRIKFKNQLVLQGLFRPKEKIAVLYEFVKTNIKTGDEFYLYTSPPRVVLSDKKKTLFECQLYPAAYVYFGNSNEIGDHLKDELKSNLVSIEEANEFVKQNVHDKIRSIDTRGMDWLQREHSMTSNLMKNVQKSLRQNDETRGRDDEGSGRMKRSNMEDLTNQKLSKFLGKKH